VAANREIERKFLVGETPRWLEECPYDEIAQGYVALEEGVEVRLRRAADECTLTVKRGAGVSREEREIGLTAEDFETLWPLTEGRRVRKRRYRREIGEGTLEIDVYGGSLEGLMTAEIEFPSEAESEAFEPPAWLGPELTGDARWANRSLAVAGAPVSTG
jgi:CYTH domain-containing protein